MLTESGAVIKTHKILIATGGFTGLKNLFDEIKPGKTPTIELKTQTISYLKISAKEAERLRYINSFSLIN